MLWRNWSTANKAGHIGIPRTVPNGLGGRHHGGGFWGDFDGTLN